MDIDLSVVDIKPEDCSPALRIRIGVIMQAKKYTWQEALYFLATKVVSPNKY